MNVYTVPVSYTHLDVYKRQLYSFAYNVGAGNFQTSTLLRKINQGDQKGACDQLRRCCLLYTSSRWRESLLPNMSLLLAILISNRPGEKGDFEA